MVEIVFALVKFGTTEADAVVDVWVSDSFGYFFVGAFICTGSFLSTILSGLASFVFSFISGTSMFFACSLSIFIMLVVLFSLKAGNAGFLSGMAGSSTSAYFTVDLFTLTFLGLVRVTF